MDQGDGDHNFLSSYFLTLRKFQIFFHSKLLNDIIVSNVKTHACDIDLEYLLWLIIKQFAMSKISVYLYQVFITLSDAINWLR